MFLWFTENLLEVIASLTGIVAIFFQIKAKPIYWPISIINVLLYIFVFYQARLYAEIILQVYYLFMSIYGWTFWLKKANNKSIPISKTNLKTWITIIIVVPLIWLSMAFLLKKYSNTDVPFIDSFITSLSFVATYLLARKKIENWLIWIFVNFLSISLYFYKQLYATIILFVILTILAIFGYKEWKKKLYVHT